MCLRIKSDKLVAETDLLVYKCLDKRYQRYITPFQYLQIDFDEDVLLKVGTGLYKLNMKGVSTREYTHMRIKTEQI